MTIEQLGGEEGTRLREVRLRALQDAPDALGSTYAEQEASVWFVASRGGVDVGLVGGVVEDDSVHLISMWIAPEARGTGIAGFMVDEVVTWARGKGVEEVGLWSADHNHAARALYARKGFVPSGKVMALPHNQSHYVLSLIFRTARRQDVPAIVAMLADDPLGAKREGDPSDERYLHAFDRIDADPHDELIVAEVGGKVVGTMQLTYLAGLSRLGAERCQIEAVRVAASTRGMGLGGKMVTWGIGRARARGCAMVQLTSDNSRTDAHRFYDALGFTASHVGYKLAFS